MNNVDDVYKFKLIQYKKHLHISHIISLSIIIAIIIISIYIAITIQFTSEETISYNTEVSAISLVKSKLSNKQMGILQNQEKNKNTVSNLLSEEQYEKINNIYSSQNKKTVFLTFDDGPSKNVTPLIVELLNNEKIKATFFVLGTNVEKYPNILKTTYNSGHYIANHGFSHRYSEIYENSESILNDYNMCESAIQKALNDSTFTSRVYRFPGGSTGGTYKDIKANSKEFLHNNHIAYLDWNALTGDAEGTPTKESILENLEKTVGNKNTVVLLMHDSSNKILTYETLPDVISFFKERDYCFKSLWDVL